MGIFVRFAIENEQRVEVETLRRAWIAHNASQDELKTIINGIAHHANTGSDTEKPAHIEREDFIQTPKEQLMEWQRMKSFAAKCKSGRF